MIIYDTEDNCNGKIKGKLHISLMDVDYLVSKYGIDNLKEMISKDYVEHFQKELGRFIRENKLSSQYYAAMSLGIENKSDERLLSLLSQEVEMGNLFTKSQLSTLTEEELDTLIEETKGKELDDIDNLYKLRSFMMARYILLSIEEYDENVKDTYGGIDHVKDILATSKNWEAMGVTRDVVESDYFVSAVNLAKRFNKE